MRNYLATQDATPKAGSASYSSSQMAQLYNFPQLVMPAAPTIALIELGGGYDQASINRWCDKWGYPHPAITNVSVDGASNQYTGNPQSADVEVTLDICCVIGAVFWMLGKPANIAVVFAPNSGNGFQDAVAAVASKGWACGISWGGPEDTWDAASINAMDQAFQQGNANGGIFCCASGDNGDSDGEQGLHADYPGSSPFGVSCGGTTIVVQGGKIVTESAWNAGGGAGGGGYSAIEPRPIYQVGFVTASQMRGCPDLAAAADPASGWGTPFGAIGGTSAVAPFMAAYFGICNAYLKSKGLPTISTADLYVHEKTFRDITIGNNS